MTTIVNSGGLGSEDPTGQSAHDPETQVSESVEITIPDKFKNEDGTLNQAAILKSNAALEAKLGSGEPANEEATEQTTEGTPTAFDYDNVEGGLLSETGMAHFQAEYNASEDGTLSEASYAALEKAGYPKDLVTKHITMLQAEADGVSSAYETALHEAAGGEDKWGPLMEWARDNISEAERIAFNDTLQTMDTAAATAAVLGLQARFKAGGTHAPDFTISDTRIPGASTNVYASARDMVTDMQDPRYKPGTQFQKDVDAKVARSTF